MRLTYLKLIATVFFWGSNFAVSKIALQSLSPSVSALVRFLFGTVLLFIPYFQANGFRWPQLTGRQWGLVGASALFGVFCYNQCFFGGMAHISSVRASLLITSSTIFIMVAGAMFFNEKITAIRWLGLIVTLLGTALVIVRGDFSKIGEGVWGIGETLIVGAALSWTIYTLIGKVVLREIPAITVSAFSALIGTILLFLSTLPQYPIQQIQAASVSSLLAAIYIGVTATALGFVWYYEAVVKIGAAKSAVVSNLTPVFAVIIAVVLGEELTLITVLGGLLVLLGIWLTTKN
jgi:drug/metabolite transporter (DMT)-like permease